MHYESLSPVNVRKEKRLGSATSRDAKCNLHFPFNSSGVFRILKNRHGFNDPLDQMEPFRELCQTPAGDDTVDRKLKLETLTVLRGIGAPEHPLVMTPHNVVPFLIDLVVRHVVLSGPSGGPIVLARLMEGLELERNVAVPQVGDVHHRPTAVAVHDQPAPPVVGAGQEAGVLRTLPTEAVGGPVAEVVPGHRGETDPKADGERRRIGEGWLPVVSSRVIRIQRGLEVDARLDDVEHIDRPRGWVEVGIETFGWVVERIVRWGDVGDHSGRHQGPDVGQRGVGTGGELRPGLDGMVANPLQLVHRLVLAEAEVGPHLRQLGSGVVVPRRDVPHVVCKCVALRLVPCSKPFLQGLQDREGKHASDQLMGAVAGMPPLRTRCEKVD
jgi:hypothetical protein